MLVEFIPYATLFKIPYRRATQLCGEKEDGTAWVPPADRVVCLECERLFLLKDLLAGELNEEGPCPSCKTLAKDHWRDKSCLVLPK